MANFQPSLETNDQKKEKKMEYLIIIIICIITMLLLKFAWKIKISDIKKIKEIGYDENLNKITNKLPENKQICAKILKMLHNETVQIEEKENNTASLYIAISNTIFIANIKNTFTRVQTISHECLHSVQNRTTLLFNFFFSNVYFLYFIVICILRLLNQLNFAMIHIFILTMLGVIYYAIRSYLEMDAMTNATFLAKEYMEKTEKLTPDEINLLTETNKVVTEIGIKLYHYKLLFNCVIKIVFFATFNLICTLP